MPSQKEICKIFDSFNKHQTIQIIEFDPQNYQIKYYNEDGHIERSTYIPLGIMDSSMIEGRKVDVQFGKVTKTDIENVNGRKLTYHSRKISAIKHPRPRITPLALSIMKDSLGEDRTKIVLAEYLKKANTNQLKTSYEINGQVFNLMLDYGNIKVQTSFEDKVKTGDQGVFFAGDLPDIALMSLKGRDIGEVIGHKAFKDGGKILRWARRQTMNSKETGIYIHLCPDYFFVNEIIGD